MTRQTTEILKKVRRRSSEAAKKRTIPLERGGSSESAAEARWKRALILIGVSLVLALLVTPGYLGLPARYELGDVVDRDIKASKDFLVTDEAATARKREEAARKSLAVYDLDEEAVQKLKERLAPAFETMRTMMQTPLETAGNEQDGASGNIEAEYKSPLEAIPQAKKQFEALLGISVSSKDFAALVKAQFDGRVQQEVVRLAEAVLSSGVVGNKSLVLSQVQKGILLRSVQTGTESHITDPTRFLSLEEAKQQIRLRATMLLDNEPRALRDAVVHLTLKMLQPNITFNRSETELRRQQAIEAVKPVLFQVKKGEMIVREGQRLGEEELLKLKMQAQGKVEWAAIFTTIGVALLGCLIIWVSVYVGDRYIRQFPQKSKDLLFLAVIVCLFLGIGKISMGVAEALSSAFPLVSREAIFYLLPLASGAMLVTIFFNPATGMLFAFVQSLLVTLVLEKQLSLLFFYLIGSLVAIHGVEQCRDRSTPLKAGLTVSLANAVVIIILTMVNEQMFSVRTGVALVFGVTGGLLSGVTTTGLLPLVEMIFGYTTDVRLLELASMDQPLLRQLMVQAPGSYHHSLIVGNMVEAAAKSIGANSLLARVAAYYHDIGKINKPAYFVENQRANENRHERLAPSMSSLILISHVKEGVELAKKHRLGQAIEDIIQQHHGTSVISYFYQKALEQHDKTRNTRSAETSSVLVEDYRYPGPKPQTKEAGLVMLADAVEAASRTLAEPTTARLQGLVQKIINKIFSDGQLDECELTLKDLHQIAKNFNQILSGIFHQRIEYPEAAAKGAEGKVRKDGDQGSRPAARDQNGSREDQGKSKEDLRRLGMS
ncbi:MAG: HDIG domain-containing protein [Deltaproteobacteria bacterium]|nr:HDIG domain-containing protein [Deltaproteobacteria bacterium]MBW2070847.1 HDIG domain-containing protein [Deltaproteobacteria bacterium]